MNVGGPFSGTRRSFMYRLYGGHRSFPRAVLARRGRMERARRLQECPTHGIRTI